MCQSLYTEAGIATPHHLGGGRGPYTRELPLTHFAPDVSQGIALQRRAEGGVLVVEVRAPQEIAPIVAFRKGDIIYTIGGVTMTTPDDVNNAIDRLPPNPGEVLMEVGRSGVRMALKIHRPR